jgi:hypothetical protein
MPQWKQEDFYLLRNITGRFAMAAGLMMATAGTMPAALLTFSGAVAYGSDSDGNATGGITTTSGCCQFIGVEQGAFTNGANLVSVPVTLTDGSYTFYLESADWTAGFGVTTGGLNFYFNGDSTPGISVHIVPTFDQTDFTNPFAVTSASANTLDLNDGATPGSGTSSYVSGGETVTLTGLQWVGGSGSNPYDSTLTVQRVDLTVSGASAGTPEPGTLILLGAGLGALALIRRKLQA